MYLPTPTMPNFGSLLRKKKAKDKEGSHDPNSPTFPVNKDDTYSLTPTASNRSEPLSLKGPSASGRDIATNDPSLSTEEKNDPMYQQSPSQQVGEAQITEDNAASIQNNTSYPTNGSQITPPKQNIQPAMSQGKSPQNSHVSGIKMMADGSWPVQRDAKATKGKYQLNDFNIQRTLGTGSFGRVHLIQSKHNQRFYAMKVLKKAQVVKMKQVEHTNDERRMLAEVKHPFLITLWGTFSDSKNLYMVMDFVEGGELFSLLRKSQVSLLDHRILLTIGGLAYTQIRGFPTRSLNSTLPKSRSLLTISTH